MVRFTREIIAQCFEFHDEHGRNRRKERICFDHELVRDQTNAFFAAIASVLVMKFKALEQLISRKNLFCLRVIGI